MSGAKKNGNGAAAPASAAQLEFIRAGDMEPWPGLNPRRRFDPVKLQELTESVRLRGVKQPLIVHDRGSAPFNVAAKDWVRFWIVGGERRWRAATAVGSDTIVPCMVEILEESEARELALVENMDRDDLTPVEEARGFRALEEMGWSQPKIAERFGRSQPFVSNRMRLLQLPDDVLTLVEEGSIDMSTARDVLLPYMSVPEQYRTPFFADVVATIAEFGNAADADRDDAADVIHAVAAKMTKSLKQNAYGADAPLFTTKRHDKGCDCGGGEIDFGGWRGKERRCWNITWWNAEQKRAKADKKKREARATEKAVETAGKMGDFPLMQGDDFYRRYGYNHHGTDHKFATVAQADGSFGRDGGFGEPDVFDLSAIDPTSLVVVRGWGDRYDLVSLDVAGVTAARKQFAEAVDARVKAEIAKRIETDLRTVRSEASALWRETAVVVRTLLSLGSHGAVKLNHLAKELGFKPKGDGYGGPILNGLTPEQMMDVVNVAVLRCVQHDVRSVLLFEEIVHSEMAAPHLEALRKLIPWDIQQRTASIDSDYDEEFDDEEEAEDSDDATCIECGCTDSMACEDGCSWLEVDRQTKRGVCSSHNISAEEAQALLAEAVPA